MCNLYSITTNQAAIIALFRVINRYVGNLPPMPGVFPDYPAPVIRNRNTDAGTEMATMRWGMPLPPKIGGAPVTNIRNTSSPHWRGWLKPENRCLVPANSFAMPGLAAARRGCSGLLRASRMGYAVRDEPCMTRLTTMAAMPASTAFACGDASMSMIGFDGCACS